MLCLRCTCLLHDELDLWEWVFFFRFLFLGFFLTFADSLLESTSLPFLSFPFYLISLLSRMLSVESDAFSLGILGLLRLFLFFDWVFVVFGTPQARGKDRAERYRRK